GHHAARLGLRLYPGAADRARVGRATLGRGECKGAAGGRVNSARFTPSSCPRLPRASTSWERKAPKTWKNESLVLLRLLRHALEPFLHVLHLAAQIVDIAFFRCRRCLVGVGAAARGERLEHREHLLEQLHVAADVLLERRKRRA